MSAPDRRLTPARADLAAAHLEGVVAAPRYVAGELAEVVAGLAPLRREPQGAAMRETELLRGDRVAVYARAAGWAWVQSAEDGYVGYVEEAALALPGPPPTHRVTARATFVFPAPDVKRPPVDRLPMAARLAMVEDEGAFLRLASGGWLPAAHAAPLDAAAPDWVEVAERFLGAPYLWGGKTDLGLDCSGLVQTAFAVAGLACRRDTDMQEADLLPAGRDPAAARRGDLAFWRGHVGIMLDATTLLHANAHHMAVAREPLTQALARIAGAGVAFHGFRRPPPA